MRKKLWLAVAVCLVLTAASCKRRGGNSETFQLKLGHVQITTHPYHVGATAFADKLKELTDGKITVEIFPSSQLGGEIAMIEQARMGNLDFVVAGTANLTNFNPSFTVFDFPFLFKNREHAFAVLDSAYGKEKLKALESFGLVGFDYWDNGFFDIMNGKKVITKIEDIRGLNIRVMENPVYMATFTALNCNPVPMPPAEVYTALQNGTVDGNVLSINGIYGFRFYEQQKYFMMADMFFCALPLVVSKQLYDKFPDNYKKAVQEASSYAAKIERQSSIDQEKENLAKMVAATITTQVPANRDEWVSFVQQNVWPKFSDRVPQQELATINSLAK